MATNDAAPVAGNWVTLALIVLIALNLRPFLTAPGPILALIRADTELGNGAVAMLLMGVGAFVSPAVQSVIGTRRWVLAALVVLAFWSTLRAVAPNGATLILTAVLCGTGVAFIQVVVPGIIKARFPRSTAQGTAFTRP